MSIEYFERAIEFTPIMPFWLEIVQHNWILKCKLVNNIQIGSSNCVMINAFDTINITCVKYIAPAAP